MKLQDISKQYFSGEIDKHQYIDKMYKKHQVLFDYYDYIKGTDIQRITIDNDIISVSIKGSNIKLLLDRNDRRFIPIEILNFKSFDQQEKKMLFECAKKSKNILDIGANIGWYTLNFALLSGVKVYAFEPIPNTFNYLKKHIKLNNITNVRIFNEGLSDVQGEHDFFWTEKEHGSASMKNIQKRRDIHRIKVKVNTIDNFIQTSKTSSIDLIKCDVEGAELFVFKGGIKTIQKDKPVIFTEMLRKWSNCFSYHPNDIINLLTEIGYECYGYINNKIEKIENVDENLETTNFFFFHKDKHKSIKKKIQ